MLSLKQNKVTCFKLSKCFRKLNLPSAPPKPQFILPDYHHLGGVLDSFQELPLLQPQPHAGFQTEAVTHLCRFISLHLSWLKARHGMSSLPSTERGVSKGDSTCMFWEQDLYAPTSHLNKPLQKKVCVQDPVQWTDLDPCFSGDKNSKLILKLCIFTDCSRDSQHTTLNFLLSVPSQILWLAYWGLFFPRIGFFFPLATIYSAMKNEIGKD